VGGGVGVGFMIQFEAAADDSDRASTNAVAPATVIPDATKARKRVRRLILPSR